MARPRPRSASGLAPSTPIVAGGALSRPRASDGHRSPVRVQHQGGSRLGKHPGRRGRRNAPRPGQLRVASGGPALPPRAQLLPVPWTPPALQGRCEHLFRAEHPLQPGDRPLHLIVPGALPHRPSPWSANDSTDSGTNRTAVTGSGAGSPCSCQYSRSIRSAEANQREWAQTRAPVQPPSVATSIRTSVHTRPCRASSATRRSAVCRAAEHDGLDGLQSRLEGDPLVQLQRRPAGGRRTGVLSTGQPVQPGAVSTEAGEHVARRPALRNRPGCGFPAAAAGWPDPGRPAP